MITVAIIGFSGGIYLGMAVLVGYGSSRAGGKSPIKSGLLWPWTLGKVFLPRGPVE